MHHDLNSDMACNISKLNSEMVCFDSDFNSEVSSLVSELNSEMTCFDRELNFEVAFFVISILKWLSLLVS